MRKHAPACWCAALTLFALQVGLAQEEPPLPAGLGDPEEPQLPAGLGGTSSDSEPELPAGLGDGEAPADGEDEDGASPFSLSGFWEARFGLRTRHDPHEKDASIAETRLHLDAEQYWGATRFKLATDLLLDPVADDYPPRLERGRGWLDLREANVTFTPASFLDVRAGRQILTWGTGDLVFINDMFPKDWDSFFIGRDMEYLKAPSDAVKVSAFSDTVNLDVVYTPRFDPDRFIDGRRLSYWNSTLGRRAGRDAIVSVERPDRWFTDEELALRLYRNVGGYELAAYAYRGFWKSPAGMSPVSGRATFPELSVYGASVRGGVGKGIGNVEFGYYDSLDDSGGADPLVRNGEVRFLVGYEQEIARELTLGLQYYLEHMLDYGGYRRSLPLGAPRADRDRHVATVRLTKMLMRQDLTLSLFAYYSPSDSDAHVRPRVGYKIDDHWSAEAGANLFMGSDRHTFFNQFARNNNVYVGLRYAF